MHNIYVFKKIYCWAVSDCAHINPVQNVQLLVVELFCGMLLGGGERVVCADFPFIDKLRFTTQIDVKNKSIKLLSLFY